MTVLHFLKFRSKLVRNEYEIGTLYVSGRRAIKFVECVSRNMHKFIVSIPSKYTMEYIQPHEEDEAYKIVHIEKVPDGTFVALSNYLSDLVGDLDCSIISISSSSLCTNEECYRVRTDPKSVISGLMSDESDASEEGVEEDVKDVKSVDKDEVSAEIEKLEKNLQQYSLSQYPEENREDTQIVTPDVLKTMKVITPPKEGPKIVFEDVEAELRDLMWAGNEDHGDRRDGGGVPVPPHNVLELRGTREVFQHEREEDEHPPLRFQRPESVDFGFVYVVIDLINLFKKLPEYHYQITGMVETLEKREEEVRDEKTEQIKNLISNLEIYFISKVNKFKEEEKKHSTHFIKLSILLEKSLKGDNQVVTTNIRKLLSETQQNLFYTREMYKDMNSLQDLMDS